jgi:hypothetical protein
MVLTDYLGNLKQVKISMFCYSFPFFLNSLTTPSNSLKPISFLPLNLYLAALTFLTSLVIASYAIGMSFFAESNFLKRYFERSKLMMLRDIPFSGQLGITRHGVRT